MISEVYNIDNVQGLRTLPSECLGKQRLNDGTIIQQQTLF